MSQTFLSLSKDFLAQAALEHDVIELMSVNSLLVLLLAASSIEVTIAKATEKHCYS
jgi:hypothetical protein